jgi:hypothetical protein
MQKRVGMDNENKFYNIYRLCRKEGALTTRTGSTIYIDYAEKRAWYIYVVELVLVIHAPFFCIVYIYCRTCSRCPCPLFSA